MSRKHDFMERLWAENVTVQFGYLQKFFVIFLENIEKCTGAAFANLKKFEIFFDWQVSYPIGNVELEGIRFFQLLKQNKLNVPWDSEH